MPRLQFSDIYTRVEQITNINNRRALIKDAIQWGLDDLTSEDLPYLMSEGIITTVAPYTTGTVTATNNSKTITGSGTTFTAAMVGRKIRVSTDTPYYRIAAFVSTTEVTLDTVYQGTTTSGATYSIYKDEYRLASDTDVYKVMRQIENNVPIGSEEASAFDIAYPSNQSQGDILIEALIGTKLDTYTTGTVSGTVNTSTITGSGTSWTSVEGLGKGTRITISNTVYTVKSVDSDTQVTIYESISATFSGSTYSLLLDNLIVQFKNIPDSIENIYYRYQRNPYPLVNDQDIPDLPDKYHMLLVLAGEAWAWNVKDKEEAKAKMLMFEGKKKQMHGRIGHISRARTYPRASQDSLSQGHVWLNLPSNTGYPIPYVR